MNQSEDIETWGDALEAAVAASRGFDRARVVRETESTQDAARAAAGGRAGLVLVAGRQTRGRGRHGRTWELREGLGVALTAVVPEGESEFLAMAGGLAAWSACRRALGGLEAAERMRIKAPNDIVVDGVDRRGVGVGGAPDDAAAAAAGCAGRRKLAGVLIEQADGLAMIGIGINVLQGEEDFTGAVRGSACSLAMLGSAATRLGVIVALVDELDRWLAGGAGDVRREWERRLSGEGEGGSTMR